MSDVATVIHTLCTLRPGLRVYVEGSPDIPTHTAQRMALRPGLYPYCIRMGSHWQPITEQGLVNLAGRIAHDGPDAD